MLREGKNNPKSNKRLKGKDGRGSSRRHQAGSDQRGADHPASFPCQGWAKAFRGADVLLLTDP